MPVDANTYIGLGKRPAQNKAERDNLIFRLIRVDGENLLPYPDDKRDDRICVEMDNEKVSKATIS